MARRSFDVVDVTEILIHWHAGRSISEVSTSLGVDRKTIRKYLAPAVAAGLTPGGPSLVQAEWAASGLSSNTSNWAKSAASLNGLRHRRRTASIARWRATVKRKLFAD